MIFHRLILSLILRLACPPLFKQTYYSKFMFRLLNPTVINVLIFKVTEKVWPDEYFFFSDKFFGSEIDIYELVFVFNLSNVFIVKSDF